MCYSIIELFKNALLALENFTFRAAPHIRHLFPWSSRGYTVLWIALGRIVDPVAFKTDPPFILLVSWHGTLSAPLRVRKLINLVFLWMYEYFPWYNGLFFRSLMGISPAADLPGTEPGHPQGFGNLPVQRKIITEP